MQAIAIVGIAIAILVTRADPDLWGHVRFGGDILRTHALPSFDPYSFTSDRSWVNHEWLSEVAFAAAYTLGGGLGLIAFKLLLIVAAGATVVAIARADGTRGRPLVIIGGLTVAAMLPRASQIRPQLFSVVCFAILLNVLRRAGKGQTRALLIVAPLFVVWANAHGGWLVGCAAVWAWSCGRVLELRREPAVRWIPPVAVSIAAALATLVTPYGVVLWSFLGSTVGPSRAFIAEWGPITSVPLLIVPWVVFWALLILSIRRGGIPANPAEALIPIALGLASAKVSRLDTFFGLSVLGLQSREIARFLSRRSAGATAVPSRVSSPWHIAAALGVLAVPLAPMAPFLSCISIREPLMPEPEALRTIQSGALRGRMVTFFDWGEFAIWYLPPGLRISMDGRRETVYSQQTIDRHLELFQGTRAGIAYLRQLDPDYVWLPNKSPTVDLLRRTGWIPLFAGNLSTILARPLMPLSTLGANTSNITTALAARRCFPGP